MNEKQFKNRLNHLVEKAFPDDGQVWQQIQQHIVQASLPTRPLQRRWVPIMAGIILLIVVIFSLTPAGMALAEMMRKFGTKPEKTPSPLNICYEDPYGYACDILRAEERSGFDAKEFPGELETFQFDRVLTATEDLFVMQYTLGPNGGAYFLFSQGSKDHYLSYVDQVPEDALREVWVGPNRGEFVQGRYYWWGNPPAYVWAENVGSQLQWVDEDRWYEIDVEAAMGDQFIYLNSEYLIDLALSLVDESTEIRQLRLQCMTSLEEIRKSISFEMVEPSILPEDFAFSYGSYDETSPRLILHYSPENQAQLAELLITETPLENVAQQEEPEGEIVWINGHIGRYTSTSAYNHSVTWDTATMRITVSLNVSEEDYGIGFKKKEFLEIARGLE